MARPREQFPTSGPAGELEPQERLDFLHRIRVFPETVASWRKGSWIAWSAEHPLFLWLTRKRLKTSGHAVDDGISHLREIARIVALLYGKPIDLW